MEMFVCPTCSQEFAQIGDLKRHQDREHPNDEINNSNFNICVCQKIFNNDSQFLKHLQSKSDYEHQEKYNEMLKKMHSSKHANTNGNGMAGSDASFQRNGAEYDRSKFSNEEMTNMEASKGCKLDCCGGDVKKSPFTGSSFSNVSVDYVKPEQTQP